MRLGGQVVSLDSTDNLDGLVVPRTIADHLLSEDERVKAEQERKEFEALGSALFLNAEYIYPIAYEFACERVASGATRDQIQSEMTMVAANPDLPFAAIIRQAYDDVLAGRPPRFSSSV
jgi:hypothetical protein